MEKIEEKISRIVLSALMFVAILFILIPLFGKLIALGLLKLFTYYL